MTWLSLVLLTYKLGSEGMFISRPFLLGQVPVAPLSGIPFEEGDGKVLT